MALDVIMKDGTTTITLKNTQWAYGLDREIKAKGWFNNSDAEEGATAIDGKKALATWTLTGLVTSLANFKTLRDNILTVHNSAGQMELEIGAPDIDVDVFLASITARSTQATGGDGRIEVIIVLIEGKAFKLWG